MVVSRYAVHGVPSASQSQAPQAPQAPQASHELQLRGPESSEELDPELLALPDPPRRERTLTVVVLAVAAVLSLAMVFALRHDVAYAVGGSTAADLGDLHAATGATLAGFDNRYVRADSLLGAAGGIRYERPFVDDTFRTLPVAGRRDVWVDVRVPAGHRDTKDLARLQPARLPGQVPQQHPSRRVRAYRRDEVDKCLIAVGEEAAGVLEQAL